MMRALNDSTTKGAYNYLVGIIHVVCYIYSISVVDLAILPWIDFTIPRTVSSV